MQMTSVAQCNRNLDFQPRQDWSAALPAYAWEGELLCGFARAIGEVVELRPGSVKLPEAVKALYPELGLAEVGRLTRAWAKLWPEMYAECAGQFFLEYGLRRSDRLEQTLSVLAASPLVFQNLIDEKKWGARDLSVLLAVPDIAQLAPFLEILPDLELSRFEAVRSTELVAELMLMGKPLNDLLPASNERGPAYLKKLEKWRKPNSQASDEERRELVRKWPWPAQVQGQWQRFGDQAGLDVHIRATSAVDFDKKLKGLISIGDNWHALDN